MREELQRRQEAAIGLGLPATTNDGTRNRGRIQTAFGHIATDCGTTALDTHPAQPVDFLD